MARLTDAPTALRRAGAWRFARRIWTQIQDDNLLVLSAAMAYSWLFAVFPFFLFLLSLVPYLPEDLRVSVRDEMMNVVERSLAEEGAQTMRAYIEEILTQPRGGLLSIGIVVTLWVASGGMAMTMDALNKCYDVEVKRAFYVERPIAVGLTIVVGILVLSVLVLIPVGTVATHYFLEWSELEGRRVSAVLLWAWNVGRWSLGVGFMLLVLAIVYYFGATRVRHNFRLFSPGAVFCIVVWVMLGAGFRFYVDNYGRYEHMYGALGGVIVLLMLFYLVSLVLLVGAEINAEIDLIVRGEPEGASDTDAAPAVGEAGDDEPKPDSG